MEQRKHLRYSVRWSVQISTGDNSFVAQTQDLSAGGCRIDTAHSIAEGATVQLEIFVVVGRIEDRPSPRIPVTAEVVWAAETDDGRSLAGLQFTAMKDDHRIWLTNVLQEIGA